MCTSWPSGNVSFWRWSWLIKTFQGLTVASHRFSRWHSFFSFFARKSLPFTLVRYLASSAEVYKKKWHCIYFLKNESKALNTEVFSSLGFMDAGVLKNSDTSFSSFKKFKNNIICRYKCTCSVQNYLAFFRIICI
jgi:hypothetical protein